MIKTGDGLAKSPFQKAAAQIIELEFDLFKANNKIEELKQDNELLWKQLRAHDDDNK